MSYACPICHKRFDGSKGGSALRPKYYPFCSEQCKLIDLGAWLDADYRVVSTSKPEEPEISENGF